MTERITASSEIFRSEYGMAVDQPTIFTTARSAIKPRREHDDHLART